MDYNPPGSSVYGISRQEYQSGLPFPSPGDLPNPGIKSASPAVAGGFFTSKPPGKASQDNRLTKTSYSPAKFTFQILTGKKSTREEGGPVSTEVSMNRSGAL